jgi:outer membrane protein OmpA-like peptidoglycan-associated protein
MMDLGPNADLSDMGIAMRATPFARGQDMAGIGWPWWVGLAVIPLVLTALTAAFKADAIEDQLGGDAAAAVSKAEINGVDVGFDGRDATVRVSSGSKVAPQTLERARDLIAEVDGVRVARTTPRGDVTPVSDSDAGSGGVEACAPLAVRRRIEQFLGDDRITFAEAQAEPDARSRGQVGQVGRLLTRCPDLRVTVSGYTDVYGADGNLSLRRAQSVRQLLIATGVAPDAVTVVAGRNQRPRATNQTTVGRAANRYARIEIE